MSLGALAVKLKKAFKFVDQSYLAANAATNSFSTIAVSGQSNVVADSATDTLTLAAGSNITLTTDATTDTVTIAASVSGSGWTLLQRTQAALQTSINFPSIPAGTREVVIEFEDTSLSATSSWIIQIGPSGGVETTGYTGVASSLSSSAQSVSSQTTGIRINGGIDTLNFNGHLRLQMSDSTSNTWTWEGQFATVTGSVQILGTAGKKSLAGALSQLTVTTINGTDTVDAGFISVWTRS